MNTKVGYSLLKAAIGLLLLFLIGFAINRTDVKDIEEANGQYKKITSEEAAEIIDTMGSDALILDVRTQEEFDAGHIKDAILLPDYEIEEKAQTMLNSKSQTILIYCRTGRRSAAAANVLIAMGYKNVYDFGGIVDWMGEVVQ